MHQNCAWFDHSRPDNFPLKAPGSESQWLVCDDDTVLFAIQVCGLNTLILLLVVASSSHCVVCKRWTDDEGWKGQSNTHILGHIAR